MFLEINNNMSKLLFLSRSKNILRACERSGNIASAARHRYTCAFQQAVQSSLLSEPAEFLLGVSELDENCVE